MSLDDIIEDAARNGDSQAMIAYAILQLKHTISSAAYELNIGVFKDGFHVVVDSASVSIDGSLSISDSDS